MSQKKSPEFKRMMGHRQADNDGFTYYYGKYNNYETGRSENTKRQIRNDKRSVRAKEDRRILKEILEEE